MLEWRHCGGFSVHNRVRVAAYNAGENAVLRYGRSIPRIPETLLYIPRVLAEYERLRSLLPW